MIALSLFFWIFVVLFGVIGAMRGWAQELLVSFSVILSLFIITVLGLIPFVNEVLITGFIAADGTPIPIDSTTFWARSIVVVLFTFFGYQSPKIQRIKAAAQRRERIQDTVLGILVGALNGYLVVGTLWFFLIQANYFIPSIFPPDPTTAAGKAALELTAALPPFWLSGNLIYFAVALAFAFVVIVFI